MTPATASDPVALQRDAHISPRSDLAGSLGWILFGIAVLIGSITMDRLEQQHINPYTAPGLLPGLLGLMMVLLGSILALRSWRRGALTMARAAPTADEREEWRRIWIVTALCATYCVALIGHGLPFWLASTIYVTGSILILHRMSRDEQTRRLSSQAVTKALVIGLSSAWITHLTFQDLFLVRLP
ncbi:MAG TPA: tripartite tricarboxylate transporter TctB family protein [Burkholderiaceae bacterium]|nr:tripartite tricarboxylate transporter TctB family protein [Burkholderiaceae bacterium]